MKVIVALNGSLTSEASAVLAVRYCRLYGYELQLLHIRNPQDAEEEVIRSMEAIGALAEHQGVACGRLFLSGNGIAPLADYVRETHVDTLFCTSRAKRSFFASSFSDLLTRNRLPCNIAVVRIANLDALKQIRKIALSIRHSRLSVEKFTFFASLLKAFEATGEIDSITPLNTARRSEIGLMEAKEMLGKIDNQLSHYRRLAFLMGLRIRLKHALCSDEVDEILRRSADGEYDLLVIGGERFSRFSFFRKESSLEILMRYSSINLIAYYPRVYPNG